MKHGDPEGAARNLVHSHGIQGVEECFGSCRKCGFLMTVFLTERGRIDTDSNIEAKRGTFVHSGCGGSLRIVRPHKQEA